MKRFWIWVPSLVIGLVLGLLISNRYGKTAGVASSPFFNGFSFDSVSAIAAPQKWKLIEDRTYDPFPSLARTRRIARRIIARAELSDSESNQFASRFQQQIEAALKSHGARNEAFFDQVQDSTQVVHGSPVRSRLEFPRRYYAIGNTHGVADIWCVAEAGCVTVIISLMEGA